VTDDAVRDETRQPSRPKLYQVLGPGLITGAADDDPSGIAPILRSARSSDMASPGRWCSATR
jgi:Mn2+/Fe2+ NRAMP family transporter